MGVPIRLLIAEDSRREAPVDVNDDESLRSAVKTTLAQFKTVRSHRRGKSRRSGK